MIAPTLHTERLTLRPHRIDDLESYAALFASDRAKYMGTLKRRHAWYSFTSDVAQWALLGHGAWGIEMSQSDEFVGQVAILKPDHFPETELGWLVLADFEEKGIAFEAAKKAKEFAFGDVGLSTLVSYIDPENTRSIALAERLGAVRDAHAKGDDESDLVYRHPHSQVLQ